DCEPGALDRVRHAMNGDPDEQVVRDASAARELRLVAPRVYLHDVLVRHVLDPALGQGVEDALGYLLRDRNRSRHRADDASVDRVTDATVDEVIVKQERTLERRRRALEGLTEDSDQDLLGVEVRKHAANTYDSRDRVVLDAALFESGRGGEVVVRPERHDED